MSDDLEEYTFCWNCDAKITVVDPDDENFDEKSKCQKCKMAQFDSEGNEIICMEQYRELNQK